MRNPDIADTMSGHRRRRGGRRGAAHDDAHGGQWKIAYADFVTAMMAFFLLMWLVSSATETQRAVIAKYFTTTSIFDLPKGNGVLDGGKAVMAGAEAKTERLTPSGMGGLQQRSRRPTRRMPTLHPTAAAMERQRFEALKAELEKMAHDGELKAVADNLSIDLTPEGLRIQIFDRDGEPMFASGDAEPTPRLARILDVISEVLQTVKNGVIISGHTDAQVLKRGTYSNWELSSDRANSVRRDLENDGLAGNRVLRVEGRAATDPLLPLDPLDPRNRRIAITVLRSQVEMQMRQQAVTPAGPPPDTFPSRSRPRHRIAPNPCIHRKSARRGSLSPNKGPHPHEYQHSREYGPVGDERRSGGSVQHSSNVANSSTVGYKATNTDFESTVMGSGQRGLRPGGVTGVELDRFPLLARSIPPASIRPRDQRRRFMVVNISAVETSAITFDRGRFVPAGRGW